MTAAFAMLAGNRVTHTRVTIPAVGACWLDVVVDGDVELDGVVAAVVADATYSCAVVSGGPFKGTSRFHVVGGYGGWGNDIPKKDYANDLGVKRRNVIGDAAKEAGEVLDLSTVANDTIGPKWTRPAGPASRVLHLLEPGNWYVGEDGITRIGRRPATAYTGGATLQDAKHDLGVLELASEEIAALVPGVIVEDVLAVDVEHELTPKGLRTTLWGSNIVGANGGASQWRALIEQALPDLKFRGLTEYRVVKQTGERFDLQPVRSGLGMPDLSRVKARPGIAGARASVTLGSTCLVTFVNADPGRAVVLAWEDAESVGFAPRRLDLVGEDDDIIDVPDPTGRVVRWGDPINVAVVGGGGGITKGALMPDVTATSLSRVRA